jgi:hypothetical protein
MTEEEIDIKSLAELNESYGQIPLILEALRSNYLWTTITARYPCGGHWEWDSPSLVGDVVDALDRALEERHTGARVRLVFQHHALRPGHRWPTFKKLRIGIHNVPTLLNIQVSEGLLILNGQAYRLNRVGAVVAVVNAIIDEIELARAQRAAKLGRRALAEKRRENDAGAEHRRDP